LLTCGTTGLRRWSIDGSEESAGELRLGPPQKVALDFVPMRTARTPDSRTFAIVSASPGASLVLNLTKSAAESKRLDHPSACYIDVSPNGRWVATSGWHSDRVRLWNANTGTMIHEWVLGTMTSVHFTPDSRELIISRGDGFTFWDLETMQPNRRFSREVALFPGHVAFSADGALMAIEMGPAVIHLKEVTTGRTVAKLEDPHGDRAVWMGFTPEGTQLVVSSPYAKAVHVWDLRAIRENLKTMGLDWDWPPFAPAESQSHTAPLAKIEILPGDLAKPDLTREQGAEQAIARCTLEVKAEPGNPKACNNLAWAYLTAPASLRDVQAAVPLAENAVLLAGENANYRNTLGIAYYRAGRYGEAVETLRPNLDRQDDKGLAFDLYFLAMSHHQLGETARGKDYLDWAVRWTAAQPDLAPTHLEELNLFRAEAEELFRPNNKRDSQ
jgi:hypothetical protein